MPNATSTWLRLGAQLGKSDQLAADSDRFVAEYRGTVFPSLVRCAQLSAAKRWDEALSEAVAGLALAPYNTDLLGTRANCLNALARYAEALGVADAGLEAHPRTFALGMVRAYSLIKLKHADDAYAALEELAAAHPETAAGCRWALTHLTSESIKWCS